METSILQQKVAQQRHLLPSQQELLNRLLFQLAFNNFQNIGLVGAEGSGKSTLALAIAELFSEQANVALLIDSLLTPKCLATIVAAMVWPAPGRTKTGRSSGNTA